MRSGEDPLRRGERLPLDRLVAQLLHQSRFPEFRRVSVLALCEAAQAREQRGHGCFGLKPDAMACLQRFASLRSPGTIIWPRIFSGCTIWIDTAILLLAGKTLTTAFVSLRATSQTTSMKLVPEFEII